MSSKTRAHPIVGVSREAKMESSTGEGRSISKAARRLFFEGGTEFTVLLGGAGTGCTNVLSSAKAGNIDSICQ